MRGLVRATAYGVWDADVRTWVSDLALTAEQAEDAAIEYSLKHAADKREISPPRPVIYWWQKPGHEGHWALGALQWWCREDTPDAGWEAIVLDAMTERRVTCASAWVKPRPDTWPQERQPPPPKLDQRRART